MKKFLILLLFIIFQNVSFSQTLDKKWNNLLKKSNSYKSHKVIKEEDLTDIWSVIQDSITLMRGKLLVERNKVNKQQTEISELKNKVQDITANLNKVSQEKTSIIAGGARTGQYINALWIGLGIIILVCIVLFILYLKSNSISDQKKKDYDVLSKSFEEYKTTRIEVERKLKREIQTYINKIEELKN